MWPCGPGASSSYRVLCTLILCMVVREGVTQPFPCSSILPNATCWVMPNIGTESVTDPRHELWTCDRCGGGYNQYQDDGKYYGCNTANGYHGVYPIKHFVMRYTLPQGLSALVCEDLRVCDAGFYYKNNQEECVRCTISAASCAQGRASIYLATGWSWSRHRTVR